MSAGPCLPFTATFPLAAEEHEARLPWQWAGAPDSGPAADRPHFYAPRVARRLPRGCFPGSWCTSSAARGDHAAGVATRFHWWGRQWSAAWLCRHLQRRAGLAARQRASRSAGGGGARWRGSAARAGRAGGLGGRRRCIALRHLQQPLGDRGGRRRVAGPPAQPAGQRAGCRGCLCGCAVFSGCGRGGAASAGGRYGRGKAELPAAQSARLGLDSPRPALQKPLLVGTLCMGLRSNPLASLPRAGRRPQPARPGPGHAASDAVELVRPHQHAPRGPSARRRHPQPARGARGA
jgi:hypothetical protein